MKGVQTWVVVIAVAIMAITMRMITCAQPEPIKKSEIEIMKSVMVTLAQVSFCVEALKSVFALGAETFSLVMRQILLDRCRLLSSAILEPEGRSHEDSLIG